MVALQTYYTIRDRAVDAAGSEQAKEAIMAAAGDDGRILSKIIEVVFVPISPALASSLSGDVNEFGIHDVGQALPQGFAAFATAIRIMAKADVLEMVNDLFELVLNGTEHFLTNEARCLGHYEAYAKERILIFEKKYEPITGALLLKACKVRALLQDSKGDPIVRNCNRVLGDPAAVSAQDVKLGGTVSGF